MSILTTERNGLGYIGDDALADHWIDYRNAYSNSFQTIDAAIAFCNWAATSDPTTDDDNLDGYVVGSWWWNTTAHKLFCCEDASTGVAAWRQVWPALTTELSGTITNAQLAGAIADAKLATLYLKADGSRSATGSLTIAASTPKVRLTGSEGSAIDVSLRENAGKVELYNEGGAAVLRTLYPEKVVFFSRHLPILAATGAVEAANTTWEEVIFQAPAGSSWVVTDVGVIPDKASTAFGGATNYFTLGLKDLTGPKTIASKAYSTAATVQVKSSFGTLTSPTVAAGDILVIEKSVTASGLIVQGCTFYLEMTRVS